MNKETRIFIWGLILFLICTLAVAAHVVKMITGTWQCNAIQITMLTFSAIGAFIGASKIYETTK